MPVPGSAGGMFPSRLLKSTKKNIVPMNGKYFRPSGPMTSTHTPLRTKSTPASNRLPTPLGTSLTLREATTANTSSIASAISIQNV